MNKRIFTLELFGEDNDIVIFYRDDNKKLQVEKITDFNPYFYIRSDEFEKALNSSPFNIPYKTRKAIKDPVQAPKLLKESLYGEALIRLDYDRPQEIKAQRDNFKQTYEADVHYLTRYLIDRVDTPIEKSPVRICYFDIETDMGFDIENADKPILSISVYDSFTKKYKMFVYNKNLKPPYVYIRCETKKKELELEFSYFKDGKKMKEKIEVEITTYQREKDMLNAFFHFVRKTNPDVFVTFNGERYDFPYIYNRIKNYLETVVQINFSDCICLQRMIELDSKRYGFNPSSFDRVVRKSQFGYDFRFYGRVHFDLFKHIKDLTKGEFQSYSLDYISRKFLGVGKEKFELEGEEAITYAVKDVWLMVKLNEVMRVFDYYDELRRVVGCEWNNILHTSIIADVLFLRLAKKKGIVLPDKMKIEDREKVKGAVVISNPGVYKNVVAIDASQLYPSILISFNMSPETIVYEKGPNVAWIDELGIGFRQDVKGFIPEAIETLIKERRAWKNKLKQLLKEGKSGTQEYLEADMKQFALKTIVNSASYGALLFKKFRLSHYDIGEAIPYIGRQTAMHIKSVLESEGHNVVLVDTDSSYTSLGDLPKEEAVRIGLQLEEKINKSFDEFAERFGTKQHVFNVKFEKLFSSILISSKKRYAGWMVWREGGWLKEPKFSVTGLDIVRTDTSQAIKDIQTELLQKILKGEDRISVVKWLQKKKEELRNKDLNYIAYSGGIKKRLNEYVTINPVVKGALLMNKIMGSQVFKIGDKVKWVYIRNVVKDKKAVNRKLIHKGKVVIADTIAWSDDVGIDDLDVLVDWQKMLDGVDKMVERVFDVMGWENNLHTQGSLERWLCGE